MGDCEAGFADCDRNPVNGCETSLRNDSMNCGACGMVCTIAGAAAMCSAGMCVRSRCETGRGDCDGDPTNGCEVDFTRDPANCGRCGVTCTAPGATAACTMGVCGIGRCNTNLGDCDGNSANGCETDLTSNVNHCMTCGNVCTASGAIPACRSGRCGYTTCNAGRADCDMMEANGCEVDTRSNATHCGACGRTCLPRPNASIFCSSGTCGIMCMANFDNCDSNDTNGCETDTRTNMTHCGGCGRSCVPTNGVGACIGGMCTLTRCNTGFGDCDGNPANGCETDLTSNTSHCGACGRTCSFASATGTCTAGACRVTMCTGTGGNCDGNDANGCETDLINNAVHCGACGVRCAAGRTCQVGRCTVAAFAGYMQTTPPTSVTYVDACALPGREQVLAGMDDAFWIGRLPFNVEFWGATNTEYLINTNGFVGFGTLFYNLRADNFPEMGPLASWGSLPTTTGFAPGAYIMGIDLVMGASGICIGTRGTTPNRQWIVEYRGTRIFTTTLGPSNLSFELIANETSNAIDFLYQTVTLPASLTLTAPDFVTVGLQNHIAPPGARAISYTGTLNASTRIRWMPR
jgi:hypothetical protein